jgi:UDP-2,4-diacetamido-2,4,6-trideoxy-beta-L-altropyranose hydrolase
MRCLALAEAWRAQGGLATFASCCPRPSLRRRMEDAGCTYQEISRPYPDSADLQSVQAVLGQWGTWTQIPWMVLDGYGFDREYQVSVRQFGCRLLVIDDTGHLPQYNAEIILNTMPFADRITYSCPAETLLLLGTRYALLRGEFRHSPRLRRGVPAIAKNILVTLGGSDPDNVTAKVLQALQRVKLRDLNVKILVGPANPHRDELARSIASASSRVTLETDVFETSRLMAWADVAVAAAGTTSWELAYMQVPMLLLVVAENQRYVADALAALGAARRLGSAERLSSAEIGKSLLDLIYHPVARKSMSECGRLIIDGRGADRVIAAMLYHDDDIRLRAASSDDAVLLWQWSNDAETRKNSFDSRPVLWTSHVEWYRAKLASRSTRIWILELRGIPVGQIRYDRSDSTTAQISFSIAPHYRGRRLGTKLLQLSAERAATELRVKRLQGITFVENIASARSFVGAGFTAEQTTIAGRGCLIFTRVCNAESRGDSCAPIY